MKVNSSHLAAQPLAHVPTLDSIVMIPAGSILTLYRTITKKRMGDRIMTE